MVLASDQEIEYKNFSLRVSELLNAEKYKELIALSDTIRKKKSRFTDGRWKLTAFYSGMSPEDSSSLKIWLAYEAKLKNFLAQYGDVSATPHVALASFYIGKAWKYRGSGYANTVTPLGWKEWSKNIILAKDILTKKQSLSKKCPHWFSVMQAVALGQGWSDQDYEYLFKQAVKKEPSYYFFYFAKASFYQSRWHGSKAKLMEFVDDAVSKTFHEEGYTLYARIYWSAQREFGRNMFLPGNVDWNKMKEGFEFMNKKYPNSIWNRNAYAHFACIAGDKQALRTSLASIKGNINLGAWWSSQQFNLCKSWSESNLS